MALAIRSAVTQTPKTTPKLQLAALRSHIYTMAAAFAGVVFGVLGSMGFVGSYLHSEFASENAALASKVVSMTPTASTSACVTPAGATNSAPKVKTAAAVQAANNTPGSGTPPMGGGKGGGGNGGGSGGHQTFVSQMVNGSISDTGRGSTNTITGTNTYSSTVTNNNSVRVSNDNFQGASSGSASASSNTNGGNASTGDSSNDNSSSTSVNISN